MYSVIINLLICLAVSWALGRILNRRIEECVPVTFMGTIVILYFFYLFNLLAIGRFFVYAGMLALFIAALLKHFKKKQNNNKVFEKESIPIQTNYFFREILTPGILLLLVMAVVFMIYAFNLKPAVWDELRLWATMPKALHFSQSMQVGEGALLYSTMQSYPPGMALLIYYFTAFSGTFSYGSIYVVYWIFLASLVLPALKKTSWKQWYFMLPIIFLLIVIPILLTVNGAEASGDWNFFFASLYIDPILGCLMGYAFYQAVKDPYQDAFSLCGFLLTLFVLPSFKNIGAVYACVAFAAGVIIHLLKTVDKTKKLSLSAGVKTVMTLITPVIAIALSYFSWQYIIHTKGTGEFIDMKLAGFTWTKFVGVLKGMTVWGNIPFLYYALFFILVGLLITFLLKDISKKQALIGALSFFVSFLIFFYGYTSHYGLMLSSIHRYTSTFTFAAFIYLLLRVLAGLKLKIQMSFHRSPEERKTQRPSFLWMFSKEEENSIKERANTGSQSPQHLETDVEEEPAERSLWRTMFPKPRMNAGRFLFIEILLMILAVLLLFNSKNLQLKNTSWKEAEKVVAQSETLIRQYQDGAMLNQSENVLQSEAPEVSAVVIDARAKQYTSLNPAKCYLALGGDTRKESQKHETYALAAIGTSLNIQNIWCDKLFNEAEDGLITNQKEMTEIWAEELLEKGYEYVLAAQADEDILYAVSTISPEIAMQLQEDTFLLQIIPADNSYGISFKLLK